MKIWPFDQFAASSQDVAVYTRRSRHVPRDYYTVGTHIISDQIQQGLEPIKQIRKAVGEKMEIALELHARWNLPSAIRITRAFEPYNLLWFEEAMTADPVDDLARLVQETRVPICADERLKGRSTMVDRLVG